MKSINLSNKKHIIINSLYIVIVLGLLVIVNLTQKHMVLNFYMDNKPVTEITGFVSESMNKDIFVIENNLGYDIANSVEIIPTEHIKVDDKLYFIKSGKGVLSVKYKDTIKNINYTIKEFNDREVIPFEVHLYDMNNIEVNLHLSLNEQSDENKIVKINTKNKNVLYIVVNKLKFKIADIEVFDSGIVVTCSNGFLFKNNKFYIDNITLDKIKAL